MRGKGFLQNFDWRIRRRDGAVIWISENDRTVRDADGLFLYYECTEEDVISLIEHEDMTRRALQEVHEPPRAKAAFLTAMSRELKTPLNAMIGFSELMLRKMFSPIEPRYCFYLGNIHDNGRRLLAMINDILDVIRIKGKLIALDSMVQECWIRLPQPQAKSPFSVRSGDRTFGAEGGPAPCRASADICSVKCAEFTPPEEEIAPKAAMTPERGVFVTIKDTGIGMDRKRIPTALEPFR